jgi:phospholipase/carboxylesterase
MTDPSLGLIHRFTPGTDPRRPPLLMLHGTGGDEGDLLPLGRALAPGAALLSPRGAVLENGMPRFFRRLREGVFDEDDLRQQAEDLATFVEAASAAYGIEAGSLVAVGFSNGANIASALLLARPGLLAAAVLLAAMVPYVDPPEVDLGATLVVVSNGDRDPMIPADVTSRLVTQLRERGAEVVALPHPGGHQIDADVLPQIRQLIVPPGGPRRSE